ncbi:MAG: hypothetical protein GY903_09765 [Fuerstiella sp.]|nr:hypothetical protein [Fuerstiella sp.]MCP4854766.1 hypothetical protein [Fuerstiella sp.]
MSDITTRWASQLLETLKTIRNCDVKGFDFVCPQQWDALQPTADESQRLCTACNELVHLCLTDSETLEHARAGHCIAREIPDSSELPAMYVGRATNVPPHTESQENALEWTHRERGIDDSLKNIDAERYCPKCDYPAPDWRTTCRVCGFEFGRVNRHSDA